MKKRGPKGPLSSSLVNVFELELSDHDRSALLDAHFLQLGVNACRLEHTIHILAGFIVVDVDRAHNLVHPCTGDNVCVAVALDGPVVLGCGLLLDLDELRLVDEYRWQLLQLMPRQIHQLLDALVGRRGQLRKQEAALLCVLADLLDRLTVIAQQVGLVGNNDLRMRCQKLAVAGKLGVDLLNVVDRVAALTACRVNQMQQQSAAINVAQEVVAQTAPSLCALDNARNVGMTKFCSSPTETTPRLGTRVVKW